MADLSRRSFVSKASLGVVAAGALAASAPFVSKADAATGVRPATTDLDEPVVAYLTDLRSGAVRLLHGEREVTVIDHALAQTLARGVQG